MANDPLPDIQDELATLRALSPADRRVALQIHHEVARTPSIPMETRRANWERYWELRRQLRLL